MAHKKTWTEKLHDSKDLPRVIEITEKMSKTWGDGTCVIPAPIEVDQLMRQVCKGKLTTIRELRQALAERHEATIACAITTGIFSWIAAHAAVEAEEQGAKRVTPWWRTLKSGGELNPKFPGGPDRQRALLEAEGHTIIPRGQRLFVENLDQRLAQLDPSKLAAPQPAHE
jgi:hypothetical protein